MPPLYPPYSLQKQEGFWQFLTASYLLTFFLIIQSFSCQAFYLDAPFTLLDFRTKLTMMIVVTLIAFTWESPLAGGLLTLIVALACRTTSNFCDLAIAFKIKGTAMEA